MGEWNFWKQFPAAMMLWPNRITLLRILALPLLSWLAIEQYRTAFALVYIVMVCTDWVDGIVARKLRQESLFGKRFDSVADLVFYWSAVVWVALLEPDLFARYWLLVAIGVLAYLAAELFSLWQLGHILDFHTYSSKATAIVINVFVVSLTLAGLLLPLLLLCIILVILTAVENIVITQRVANGKPAMKSILLKS